MVTNTLLGDEAAIYDPRNPNDRLLLGVKGTISEAELFTLKQRLHEGRWNKARRGELVRSLPVGYRRQEDGRVVKDPDQKVQSRVQYIFDSFDHHRVARQVLVQLVEEKLKIPVVVWGGSDHGDVTWKDPDLSSIIRLLHNPTYAGAYVYGQWEYDSFHRSPTNGKATVHPRAIEDWSVCLHDAYPAYITWDQFLKNQQTLHDNWFRGDRQGAPQRTGVVAGHRILWLLRRADERQFLLDQRAASAGLYLLSGLPKARRHYMPIDDVAWHRPGDHGTISRRSQSGES